MGQFDYIASKLQCVRCAKFSIGYIQTKFFEFSSDLRSHEYGVGETVVIDNLMDYVKIGATEDGRRLVVVMGDWCCAHCKLEPQWAVVEFSVHDEFATRDKFSAVMVSIKEFVPLAVGAFDDVHYVESDLADFEMYGAVGLPSSYSSLNPTDRPVPERLTAIVEGYQAWLEERTEEGSRPAT